MRRPFATLNLNVIRLPNYETGNYDHDIVKRKNNENINKLVPVKMI
jgi:hypothetical protein